MFKKTLAWLLALMMIIGMMPISVFAAETTNVAAIGEQGYPTLQAAIDAAQAGDTVTLLKDITLGTYVQGNTSAAVTINKAITLDGNGKTLTSKAGRAINIDVAGEVEIKNLTIKQYCGRNSSDQKRCINVINQTATVTVTDCTLEMVEHYASGRTLTSYVAGVQAATGANHNITIERCTIKTIYGVVSYAADTTINIRGSVISNALYGAWINAATTVNVENSTIATKEDMGTNNLGVAFLVQSAGVSVTADKDTTISALAPKGADGTATGGQAFALYSSVKMADLGTVDLSKATIEKVAVTDPVIYLANAEAQINREDGTVMFDTLDEAIAALTIDDDLSNFESLDGNEVAIEYVNEKLAELGSDFHYDENGNAVLNIKPVAKIGEVEYETLAEAMAAANSAAGDYTITLLADSAEEFTFAQNDGVNITIDGDGHTFTGKITLNAGAGNLTITDATLTPSNADAKTIVLNASTAPNVTIDGCTMKNTGTKGAIVWGQASSTDNKVVVKNSTASNLQYLVGTNQGGCDDITIENVTATDMAYLIRPMKAAKVSVKDVTYSGLTFVQIKNSNKGTLSLENVTVTTTQAGMPPVTMLAPDSGNGVKYTITLKGTRIANGAKMTKDNEADWFGVANDSNPYEIIDLDWNPVAKIGEVEYETLAEAIAAATANDTITFLKDITEDVTVNKSVTIDGADFQYTGTITISGDFDVTIQNVNCVKGYIVQNGSSTTAALTIKSCSFANGGYAVTTERIKYLTIEDCTVTGQSLLYAKLTTSYITVKNVTISKGNYVAHLVHGSKATFENVTATEMTGYGICTQNYGAKTITLKNCSFDAPNYYALAVRDDRTTAADTFIFEGNNTMSSLYVSEYAKYKLAAGATLTAPEDLDVVSGVEGYKVAYENGTYKLAEEYKFGTWGGIDWKLYEDGTLIISPTAGEPVPDKNAPTKRTYEVGEWRETVVYKSNGSASAIGGAPYNMNAVKTLIIEEGVTKIGSFTAQFPNLTGEVIIPSTVTYIGQEAFHKAPLTELIFAEGGTEGLCIANGAFKKTLIKEVSFPGDREYIHIHHWAFGGSANLETAYIPANVTKSWGGEHVDYFDNFNSQTNVTWVEYGSIFTGCTKMETITFENEEVRDRFFAKNRQSTNEDYIVAYVGLTAYNTLQKAVDAAEEEGEVTLVRGGQSATVGKKLTILKNGKTATITPAEGFVVEATDTAYEVDEFNPVAKIGDDEYATLTEALAAANAGDTITFLADITENVTVSTKVTIDGAGKTYTGKMTLTDNKVVTIKNTNFVKGCIDEASGAHGTLSIDSCTFDGVDKSIGYAITVRGGDKLTITNSSAKNYSTGMLYVPSAVTEITISKVNVANVAAAFNITYSGDALFEEVAFENVTYGIHFQIYGSRTYIVKNCDLSGATNPFWFWDKSDNTEKVTVVFDGNNIVPKFQNPIPAGALKLAAGATLTAPEDLTITTDVEGYEVAYKDGKYSLVEEIDPVAKIGDVEYETLAEALAAAQADDTITFLKDITENVTINKSVTIDGNDKTYTGKMTIAVTSALVAIQNVNFVKGNLYSDKATSKGTTLKVIDCDFDGQNSINHAMEIREIEQFTIEGGSVKNYNLSAVYVPSAHSKDVLISNTTFDGMGSYTIRIASGMGAQLNGVTIKNVYGGLLADTAKPYTFTNCVFENVTLPITSWSGTLTGTFTFNGENKISNLSTSNGGAFKLALGATLTAPEGLNITTDVVDHEVTYANGVYSVIALDLFILHGSNMNLDNSLDMNFFIDPAVLGESLDEVFQKANSNTWYVEITKAGRDPIRIDSKDWWYVKKQGLLFVTYNSIAAKEMGEQITVQVFTSADKKPISQLWKDSVRDYATRIMKATAKTLTSGDVKAKQRMTLMVDMLNFGAAAQAQYNNCQGYKLDDLANKNVPLEYQAYATTDTELVDYKQNAQKVTYTSEAYKDLYVGTNLELSNDLNMGFFFDERISTMLQSDYTVTITHINYHGSEKTYTFKNGGGADFISKWQDGKWNFGVSYDSIVYGDSCAEVTMTVNDPNGNPVLTVKDSVSYYVDRMSGTELPSGIPLMKFSQSIRNYLGSNA